MKDSRKVRSSGRATKRAAVAMCGIALQAILAQEVRAQEAGAISSAGTARAASSPDRQQATIQNASTPGQPAPGEQGGIADIIVTAQKRAESVQRTPIAITAIGGDTLRATGVSTVADLKQSVPTLELGEFFGVPSATLRGITLNVLNFGTESPIAFYTDGIYFGRPAAALSGFYDVERVEVLRGAQGTLYGRNATGGAINIITADPTSHLSGYAQLTYGTYNHLAVEGAVSGPLSDKIQVRLSGHVDEHDGYGINEATGHEIDNNNERAIRGKIKFLPTNNLTILLSGDYFHAHSNPGIHFQGFVGSNGPLFGTLSSLFGVAFPAGKAASNIADISQENDPVSNLTFWGVASTIKLDLGAGVALRSITSYRRSESLGLGDVDLTSAALFSPAKLVDRANQVSQEFQIIKDGERTHWILGGYYYHEKDNGYEAIAASDIILAAFGVPISSVYLAQGIYNGSGIKTDAYAAFGQYTRKLTDQLSLTLGGRYSIETKEEISQSVQDFFTPFDSATFGTVPTNLAVQCGIGLTTFGYAGTGVSCNPKKTFKAFTPKVGLDFQLTPSTLVYGSYARGFKSGTFNPGTVQNAIQPEKLDDFELGVKTTQFDGHLRANLAAFYYNYNNLQVSIPLPLITVLGNAASAKDYGLEAEIVAKPTSELQFDMNGALLHATYNDFVVVDQLRPGGDGVSFVDSTGKSVPAGTPGAVPAFNLHGKSLPQAPRVSGRLGAAYTIPSDLGSFTLRGEVAYTSRLFITSYNTSPAGAVAPHTRFNLSLNYRSSDGHLYASVIAKNLTDKRLVLNGYAGTPFAGGAVSGYLEAPRTVDFTVGYKF